VLKGISHTSAMNNTSHITQRLKDKIERLESRGKIQFYLIPGHCIVEVNERADSKAKQSIKEGRESQLLLLVADLRTQWKTKGKEDLHSFCRKTKRDGRESYFEGWLVFVVTRDKLN
jgi:hypothetical protein